MKRLIFNHFQFSRAERLGALLLTGACVVVFLAPELARRFYRPPSADFSTFAAEIAAFQAALPDTFATGGRLFAFDPNTVSEQELVSLGLPARVARTICNYRDKGGAFRRPEDLARIYSLSKVDFERLAPFIRIGGMAEQERTSKKEQASTVAEVFDFDPNSASESDLKRLGLPDRLVSNLLKYREKGGRFRVREDFRKLYGLSEKDYIRLEPYLFLPAAQNSLAIRPVTYAAAGTSHSATPPLRIDINAAGVDDWRRLPGVGEARARSIVGFRTALGGFVAPEQVAETRSLPDSIFQTIRAYLVLDTPVFQQINLNTATIEDLDAHPYISAKQARLIVDFRTQHGLYAAVDDLKKIVVFRDGSWLKKVEPYLRP